MKTSLIIAISIALCCWSFVSANQDRLSDFVMTPNEPVFQQGAIYNVPVPFVNLIPRATLQRDTSEVSPSSTPRKPLLVRIITAYSPLTPPAENSSTTPSVPSASAVVPEKDSSNPISVSTPVSTTSAKVLTAPAPPARTHVILIAPSPKYCATCGYPSHQCSCQSRVLAAPLPNPVPAPQLYGSFSLPALKNDFGALESVEQAIFEPGQSHCSSCGHPRQQCNCYSRLAVAQTAAPRPYCTCGLPPQHCVCSRRTNEFSQVAASQTRCSCGCGSKSCNCRSRFNLLVE